jgi:serine protease Do
MSRRIHGLFAVAALLTIPHWLGAQTETQRSSDPLFRVSDEVQRLAARVSPSVVKILVSGYGPVNENGSREAALIGRQRSIGSGVILDPNGYVITNAHVVAGAQRVRVTLYSRAGGQSLQALESGPRARVVEARIVGVDKATDLAVLKVEETNLPVLKLANYADLRQGQMVLAFGTPEGLENTVTMGVVSSVLRQLNPDSATVYIQTDAAINPGNSGGPLVDIDGKVVGINSSIYSESGGNEGIGFAIPSLIVSHVYKEIRAYGHVHRYEIGARLQTITPTLAAGLNLARDHGVIVSDVEPDGPAETAGLHRQDIILKLNGMAIESLPMYSASLYLRRSGDAVALEVERGAKGDTETVKLEIPVTAEDQDLDNLVGSLDPAKALVNRLGILGLEINSKMVQMFPDLRIKSGIVVAARAAGAAMESGLESGDVIHQVNTTDIASLDGLRAAIRALKPGDPVVLQIERDGALRYLAFDWE